MDLNLFKKIYEERKNDTKKLMNRYNKGLSQLIQAESSS